MDKSQSKITLLSRKPVNLGWSQEQEFEIFSSPESHIFSTGKAKSLGKVYKLESCFARNWVKCLNDVEEYYEVVFGREQYFLLKSWLLKSWFVISALKSLCWMASRLWLIEWFIKRMFMIHSVILQRSDERAMVR